MIHQQSPAKMEELEVRRLMAAGDPDSTFNNGTPALISFPGAAIQINAVAIQQDGKVVAAGSSAGSLAVTRLNLDGSIDTTFGNGGLFESNRAPEARDVAIAADGKIVLALGYYPGGFDYQTMRVGRLLANGSNFDGSFGSGGIASIPWVNPTYANAVAIQNDGKVVVAGTWQSGDYDFLVVRYDTNGAPDTSFDSDGLISLGFGEDEEALAVAIDYNGTAGTNPLYGTIVVTGEKRPSRSQPSTNFTIARLNPNGTPDSTFDSDGKMTSPDLSPLPVEYATGALIQPGGKIVVTGTAVIGAFSDFLVARYHPHGQIDASFGPDGTGVVQNDIGFDDQAVDVAPGFLGGFLVSGRNAVAAYTRDGLLDTRFSGDGFLTSFSGIAHIATSGKTIAPIRRLVIGGGNRVGRFFDVGSVVSIRSFDHEAAEAGQDPATYFVQRTEPLGTTERVYISVGGTARPPYLLNADYTAVGMTMVHPFQGRSYIEIPPNEMVAAATITPVNDTSPEGDETIVLSISTDDAYDVSALSPSTTLAIRDNDVVGGPVVSSSAFVYDSGPPQRVRFTFSQDVAGSVGADDFSISGASGPVPFSFAYDNVSNTATLSFTGVLPDGDYTARAIASGIANGSGIPMPADSVLDFFVLRGDANRDRVINITDLGILATNWQQSPRTFSQGDFNDDGTVDITDLGILATNWQKELAPAPGTAWTSPRSPGSPRAAAHRRVAEAVLA